MFRTDIEINTNFPKIDYKSKILFLGSCFAENIGNKFIEAGFNVNLNPFGVLYNPDSIKENIKIILNEQYFTENDLVKSNSLWFSYNFHSKFSNVDKDTCLNNINSSISKSVESIKNSDYIFITFGTAWVYKLINENIVVANCHKQPSKIFERYRLSINEIVESYKDLINEIKQINSNVKIVFTVSPVRHWKDGATGNQLSKSILLLAIDEILNLTENIYYFPSYEIVIDELRDYRFYKDDMLHISELAVNFIWEKFKYAFFNKETQNIILQVNKFHSALKHKPFNPDSKEYLMFLEKNINKINNLEKQYYIDLDGVKSKFIEIKKGNN